MVLIYFCLQFPMNGNIGANTIQKWWGNYGFAENADGRATPLRRLAQGEVFGYVRLYSPSCVTHGSRSRADVLMYFP